MKSLPQIVSDYPGGREGESMFHSGTGVAFHHLIPTASTGDFKDFIQMLRALLVASGEHESSNLRESQLQRKLKAMEIK